MDNETRTTIEKKVKFFFERKIPVHISKKCGTFHNGLILELAGDLIILEDEVYGSTPIHFFEILKIEKREEKR